MWGLIQKMYKGHNSRHQCTLMHLTGSPFHTQFEHVQWEGGHTFHVFRVFRCCWCGHQQTLATNTPSRGTRRTRRMFCSISSFSMAVVTHSALSDTSNRFWWTKRRVWKFENFIASAVNLNVWNNALHSIATPSKRQRMWPRWRLMLKSRLRARACNMINWQMGRSILQFHLSDVCEELWQKNELETLALGV